MSRLSIYSWVSSACVHGVMFVLLGIVTEFVALETAEIAGSRVAITSGFARPVPRMESSSHAVKIEVQPESRNPTATPTIDAVSSEPPPSLDADDLPRSSDRPSLVPKRSRRPLQQDQVAAVRVPRQSQRVSEPEQMSEQLAAVPPAMVRESLRAQVVQHAEPLLQERTEPVETPQLEEEAPPPSVVRTLGTTETTPARPLSNPSPVYPPEAVRQRVQGVVLLRIRIAEDGRVTKVDVARSSGHDSLDRAALSSIGQWRFQPATRGGRPVEWVAQLPIRFRLN